MMVEKNIHTGSGRTTVETLNRGAIELEVNRPNFGAILLQTSRTFPDLGILARTSFTINPDAQTLEGKFLHARDDELILRMDLSASPSEEMKQRYRERLDIPDPYTELSDEMFRYFIFAGKLGKILPLDRRFSEVFGDSLDKPGKHRKKQAYVNPVNTDEELLADYVTASVMGNFGPAKILGIQPPLEPAEEWRKWKEQRILIPGGQTGPIPIVDFRRN